MHASWHGSRFRDAITRVSATRVLLIVTAIGVPVPLLHGAVHSVGDHRGRVVVLIVLGAVALVGDGAGLLADQRAQLLGVAGPGQAAANKAQTATQTFADTVKSLGKPDTTSGSAASDAVTQLDDELTAGASSIEDAVKGVSGVNATLAAVSSVSGTLATMGTQVSATVTTLQQLDAKGELENAFSQSSACQSLEQKS